MASLEEEFRVLVLHFTSATFGERFYWNKVADGADVPYIRATTITDKIKYHQQGRGPGKSLVQLDIFSDVKSQCNSAAEAILNWLEDGYRGQMGDYNVRIFATDIASDYWPESRQFHRLLEVEIGYVR